MRRRAASLVLALSVFLATGPASAQNETQTGIALSIADGFGWDEHGGWIVLPAGGAFGKDSVLVTELAATLAPGAYDVYWDQGAGADPVLIAAAVEVTAGAVTEVRVATGVALSIADWVPRRVEGAGWFGAIHPTATEFDFVNRTRTGDALFLPPGTYEFYYEFDETDDLPPVWLGIYDVEPPVGGVGLEVTYDGGGIVTIVRAAPGGAVADAGVLPDDIVLAIDGQALAGLSLADALALMRGAPETELLLAIRRGKETLDLVVTRRTVEPRRVVSAAGGIRLVTPDGTELVGPNGWWGAVFAGQEPTIEAFLNWQDGASDRTLLLGPTAYDVYWDPAGTGIPRLIATGVAVSGAVVEVIAPSPIPTKIP